MCQTLVLWLEQKQNSVISYSRRKEADNKHIDQGLDSTRPDRNILGFVHHLVSVTTTQSIGLAQKQP